MADHRPDVYVEEGKVIYRASALGSCLKALTAIRLGVAEKEDEGATSTVLHEGDLHEVDVKERLVAQGWSIYGEQTEIDLEVLPNVFVRGHLDALCEPVWAPGIEHVLEVKSMSKDVFARWENRGLDSQPGYGWQISIYMHALGRPGVFALKDRNLGRIAFLKLPEAPVSMTEIVGRVRQVEESAAAGTLPECDIIEQWRCHVPSLHPVTEYDEVSLTDPAFDLLLQQYEELRKAENLAASEREVLREEILTRLGEREAVRTDQFQVKVRQTSTKRLNTAKAKKALGKAAEQFMETSTYSHLTVERAP